MKNKTLDYYNHHAQSFISITVSVNFKPVQDKFIHALNGPKILDFGCGSGRDTKYFLESSGNRRGWIGRDVPVCQ